MKKESQNLGSQQPCPECKRNVLIFIEMIGHGKFQTKCPHCGVRLLVEIHQKTSYVISKIGAALALCILVGFSFYQMIRIESNLEAINTNLQTWVLLK